MVKNDHEPAFAPAELSPFRRSVVIVVLSNQVQLQVDYGLGYTIGTAIQESLKSTYHIVAPAGQWCHVLRII